LFAPFLCWCVLVLEQTERSVRRFVGEKHRERVAETPFCPFRHESDGAVGGPLQFAVVSTELKAKMAEFPKRWAALPYNQEIRKMTPFAQAIGDALLKRHKELCSVIETPPETLTKPIINSCTIKYLPLCEAAGEPRIKQIVGEFLDELAEWCESEGFPPINALAVSAKTRRPSGGYNKAPGCRDWDKEVKECIVFKDYPRRIPAATGGTSSKALHAFEADAYKTSKGELKEDAIIGQTLIDLFESKTPLVAVRLLLNAAQPTTGFKTLVNIGREDLTLESLALRHQAFFTARQIWVAKTRLATAEYQAYLARRSSTVWKAKTA
jgi:hypothetical protein